MAVQSAGEIFSPATLFDQDGYTSLFAYEGASVCAGFGFVNGQGVYAVWQNGDPLGCRDVEVHTKTLKLAAKTGNPVVTFYNSKGSLLEEGQAALAAASALSQAVSRLSGVVPQISVITGVCGASNALAAAGGDLVVLCKEAQFFLTAPFTSSANGDKLPDAGTPQAAVRAGIAALVCDEKEEAILQVAKLLALLPQNNLAACADFVAATPSQTTLSMQTYSAQAAAKAIADTDSALELFSGFGNGAKVFLATAHGMPVGIVATEGEKSTLCQNDSAKIARFVRFCDAFSLPILSVLNSAGFEKSTSEDVAGNLREVSRLAATYADATTAKIAIVAGRAVGTLYTALGSADVTIAVEGCVLSPVEPSAVVSVLQRSEIEESGANIETETTRRAKIWATECASATAAQNAKLADVVSDFASLNGTVEATMAMLASKRAQRLPKKHGNMPL